MAQITRLVYWNESAGGWYDVETDVSVKNMTAPIDKEGGADLPDPIPRGTGGEMNEPLMHSEIREIVREEARAVALQVLAERTIPPYPNYFFNSDWIVTYDWMHDADQALHTRINELEKKVACLSRPWWRIW